MRLEYTHRLARLHQQGLIILEFLKGADDGVITLPIARRFPGAAVNHKFIRSLCHFFIEVVHQHAHGGFLLPTLAGKRRAAGRANWGTRFLIDFGLNRHKEIVFCSE